MLLPKENIPFLTLTEGEATLRLLIRNQQLRAIASSKEGNVAMANSYRTAYNYYREVQQQGLHTAPVFNALNNNPTVNSVLVNNINHLKSQQASAIQASTYTTGTAAPSTSLGNLDFALTATQSQECVNSVRQQLGIGNTPYVILIREGRAGQYDRALAECREKKLMENIVNGKLEGHWPSMFYEGLASADYTYNPIIRDKRFDQKTWIKRTADTTGLSTTNINLIIESGIINEMEQTPEYLKEKLRPALITGGSNNLNTTGALQFLNPVTTVLLIKLLKAVAVVLVAGTGLVKALKEVKRRDDIYQGIKDPSIFAPAEEDFNNNGIADSQETAFQTAIAGPLLPAAAAIFAFVDPFGWAKDNYANEVIGAGLGFYALTKLNSGSVQKWIVNGKSLTAAEMEANNYTFLDGSWYPNELLVQYGGGLTTFDFKNAISQGETIYKKSKEAIELIKQIFGGQDAAPTYTEKKGRENNKPARP